LVNPNPYASSEIPETERKRKRVPVVLPLIISIVLCWISVITLFGLATHFGISGRDDSMKLCVQIFFPVWGVLGIVSIVGAVIGLRNGSRALTIVSLASTCPFAIASYNMLMQWMKM
jgi:uncharacterized membrane protein (UPF0136 family)